VHKAADFSKFDAEGRMKPSAFYDRVVDVMEELIKFTLLARDRSAYLVDRYSKAQRKCRTTRSTGEHSVGR